jgi:hypothetical protein
MSEQLISTDLSPKSMVKHYMTKFPPNKVYHIMKSGKYEQLGKFKGYEMAELLFDNEVKCISRVPMTLQHLICEMTIVQSDEAPIKKTKYTHLDDQLVYDGIYCAGL